MTYPIATLLALTLIGGTALAAEPVAVPEAPEPVVDEAVDRLAPFFGALQEAAEGSEGKVVRILWWGDSAIVSDGYTGRLRQRLQARFGDAGPGFILAAPCFAGYLRDGVRLKRHHWETRSALNDDLKSGRYGLGAVRSFSYGGAGSTYEIEGKPVDFVDVFYQSYSKGGLIQLFIDDSPAETASIGSRAAEGAEDLVWHYELDKPATSVRLRAGGKGGARIYGVAFERKGPGVVLDTLGVLGMRARRLHNMDPDHLAGQVRMRGPSLLVINYGGNERVDPGLTAEGHADDIRKTLRMIKAGAPDAACLVVAPIAHGRRSRGRFVLDPALAPIYEGQRAAARAEGCAFLDTVALMGGASAVGHFRRKGWLAGDLAHLNNKGHKRVGELLADWFESRYDAWRADSAQDRAATPAQQPAMP